jgi:cytidyltransferase-like protein
MTIKNKITVVSSGYFDPLHVGHLEYFDQAKKLGDYHIVIVNNDVQLGLKRGNNGIILMNEYERCVIVQSIIYVDHVVLSIDIDKSVCKTLEWIAKKIDNKIIFAKGGDRNVNNIPESDICKKLGIDIIDGLGEKIQASSVVLSKLK